MFDKFGEFNSVEELNAAAEGFRNEGDLESLMALAQENGLDPDDAQDYVDGIIDKLENGSYGSSCLAEGAGTNKIYCHGRNYGSN